MPKYQDGDFVIFKVGPSGGFIDTTAGKPYEVIDRGWYRDDAGDTLMVEGWKYGEFEIDRIITAEQYAQEFAS